MFTLTTALATRTGTRRAANQDRTLVTEGRVAVADGIGGHHGGDIAAGIATRTLADLPPADSANDVVNGVWTANAHILDRALTEPALHLMGTTLVTIEILPNHTTVAVVAIGDSRAYLLRDGHLRRITTDHTWETTLLQAGVEAPVASRSRHVLTRSLGATAAIDVDAWTIDLRTDDRFLLCSDGVWGALDDDTLTALLDGPDDGRTADRIVVAAVGANSHDDVTAAVADVVPADDRAARLRRLESAQRHPSWRAQHHPGRLGPAVS